MEAQSEDEMRECGTGTVEDESVKSFRSRSVCGSVRTERRPMVYWYIIIKKERSPCGNWITLKVGMGHRGPDAIGSFSA